MDTYREKLYVAIVTVFSVVVIFSNLLSVKLFQLPFITDLAIPVGTLFYPLTFLLSDLITEIYGAAKAKFMIYIAFFTSLFGVVMVKIALFLPQHQLSNHIDFASAYELNAIIVASSLLAYLVAQVIDVQLFAKIKRLTEGKYLWLRSNVSTLASQLIDTVIIYSFLLRIGMHLDWTVIMKAICLAYSYKAFFSICNTPLFYGLVAFCKKTLNQQEITLVNIR